MASSLKLYRSRRDFRRSPEPRAEDARNLRKDGNPIFVFHEHHASHHHFDLRLEIDGVLKSWAVPKGPSTDPREKRLAVAVEDHPLSYADFEGVIPEGEYGAGTVLVWDAGPYRNLCVDDGDEIPIERALAQGHLEVWLEGKKIRGGYALVKADLGDDRDDWLLIKMDDSGADARRRPVNTEPRSVLSGRTADEIRKDEGDRA